MPIYECIFSKKYAKTTGIPSCAIDAANKNFPCTKPKDGEVVPEYAEDAWEWVQSNRTQPLHEEDSTDDSGDSGSDGEYEFAG